MISLYGKVTKQCDLKIFNRYATTINSGSVTSYDNTQEILLIEGSSSTSILGFLEHKVKVGGGHYSQDDCVITISNSLIRPFTTCSSTTTSPWGGPHSIQ